MRYIYVVSREHPWLYRHLLERFQDDPDVQVVLDRRVAERRSPRPVWPSQERRKKERRRPLLSDEDLRLHSHYIVEL